MDRDWVQDLIQNFSSATIVDMDIPKLINDKHLNTPNRLFKISLRRVRAEEPG